jgi:hypothetical protein
MVAPPVRAVFLSIGSRRVEYFACTSSPNTAWMVQKVRTDRKAASAETA